MEGIADAGVLGIQLGWLMTQENETLNEFIFC
jgi:hypothetical protein